MARIKLNMTPEERRKYNNEMHRKQTRARRLKAEKEAYKEIVKTIAETFEKIGWTSTDLLVGADDEMIDRVVDELMQADRFKIVLGSKIGVKIKEKGDK